MDFNNLFSKNRDNKIKEENKNDFIKNLQSNVKNKKKSLNHYNELILNDNKLNK